VDGWWRAFEPTVIESGRNLHLRPRTQEPLSLLPLERSLEYPLCRRRELPPLVPSPSSVLPSPSADCTPTVLTPSRWIHDAQARSMSLRSHFWLMTSGATYGSRRRASKQSLSIPSPLIACSSAGALAYVQLFSSRCARGNAAASLALILGPG